MVKHADSLIGMGLLVTFLAGGVLQDVNKLGDPGQWINLLSTEVPRNSTFFISLIFFSGKKNQFPPLCLPEILSDGKN